MLVSTSAGTVEELEINPRAMRMMSEDLAAAVKATIAAAVADHELQTLAALQEARTGAGSQDWCSRRRAFQQ